MDNLKHPTGSGDDRAEADLETPALRLFALVEYVVGKDTFVSLQSLATETGIPKPTLHRMLQQLEGAGMLIRQADGRHYGTGARLRRFAETLLLNATQHGARQAVLRDLVKSAGETCFVAALSGSELLYVDLVETRHRLRFSLAAGDRMPLHCTAGGKMGLAGMPPAQYRKLLAHAPLAAFTPRTCTDLEDLEAELRVTRQRGWALEVEEYSTGLVGLAVPVPVGQGRSNFVLGLQAPTLRLPADQAVSVLPLLRHAAQAMAEIDGEGAGEGSGTAPVSDV
ncbi:IclR family transcriptional regulator [Streptomyces sp. NPDC049954]|uniref:IclR family transcriptional regulator n=1 Tax=Streptomyces sp. NPDC049954 TaxID=3155779 RepID=UPI00342DFE91